MATFREIAERARVGGRFGEPLVAELAEALDVFEYNTARMFAVFNVAEVAGLRLDEYRQQIQERTRFVLDSLRTPRS